MQKKDYELLASYNISSVIFFNIQLQLSYSELENNLCAMIKHESVIIIIIFLHQTLLQSLYCTVVIVLFPLFARFQIFAEEAPKKFVWKLILMLQSITYSTFPTVHTRPI